METQEFMKQITREIHGIQGHTESVKTYKVYANEDGEFENSKETIDSWSFRRRGWVIKAESIEEARKMYDAKIIPLATYRTLFDMPSYDTDRYFYSKPHGFLRGDTIANHRVHPKFRDNPNRNHYRAINEPGKLSVQDINDVVDFMAEYVGIKKSDIEYRANPHTKAKMQHILEEVFEDDSYLPEDFILFYCKEPRHEIITKLVSPHEEFRGVGFNDEGDLVIHPIGFHITGRECGALLYIGAIPVNTESERYTLPLDDSTEGARKVAALIDAHKERIDKAFKQFTTEH